MPTFVLPYSRTPCAFVSALNSVVLPEPGRPTIPTSSAIQPLLGNSLLQSRLRGLRSVSCFWSETSARCWSDLIAPSVLPRIVAASPFEKLKTNFSVNTCFCSCERRLDQLQHALASDRLERTLLGGGLARSLRARAAPPRAATAAPPGNDPWRGCGRSGTARPRTVPTASGTPDRLQHLEEGLRRQVLGVVPVADAHVQVAVDPVEMDQVQLLERVAVALLRTRDQAADVILRRGVALGLGLGHRADDPARRAT